MCATMRTLARYCTLAAGCGGLKAGPPTLASQMLAAIDTSVHTVNAVIGTWGRQWLEIFRGLFLFYYIVLILM
jgi:hypothetical protein